MRRRMPCCACSIASASAGDTVRCWPRCAVSANVGHAGGRPAGSAGRARPRHARRCAPARRARHQAGFVADPPAPGHHCACHHARQPSAGRLSRRLKPPAQRRRVARAADERPQVDVGQHALRRPASGWSRGRPLRTSSANSSCSTGCSSRQPSRRQAGARARRRSTMRASTWARSMSCGVELLAALEQRHARAQVGELPGRAVHDGQRQARGDDLALDGVVVDQRQRSLRAAGPRQVARRAMPTTPCAAAPAAAPSTMPLVPGLRARFFRLLQQVAPAHGQRRLGRLVEQRARAVDRTACTSAGRPLTSSSV